MEIKYKNKQIERVCIDAGVAQEKHGIEIAKKLFQRLNEIRASNSLDYMLENNIGGCHKLIGDREGQYAFYLKHPFRLIVEEDNNDIKIVIIDYHKK